MKFVKTLPGIALLLWNTLFLTQSASSNTVVNDVYLPGTRETGFLEGTYDRLPASTVLNLKELIPPVRRIDLKELDKQIEAERHIETFV